MSQSERLSIESKFDTATSAMASSKAFFANWQARSGELRIS